MIASEFPPPPLDTREELFLTLPPKVVQDPKVPDPRMASD